MADAIPIYLLEATCVWCEFALPQRAIFMPNLGSSNNGQRPMQDHTQPSGRPQIAIQQSHSPEQLRLSITIVHLQTTLFS